MAETPRELRIPELALVVLVGVSGSGKSTFAARNFRPTQVVSSDFCRAAVSDDENDQSATADAFDLLNFIVGKRLARGLPTVVDATNVQRAARAPLVRLAREHHVLPVAIVLDVPEGVAQRRNRARTDRALGEHVVPRQRRELRRDLRRLEKEGFRRIHVLTDPAEIDTATVVPERLWNDRRELTGPFDLVGDVHGCRAELEALLDELGYQPRRDELGRAVGARHPEGRTAVFVGDLVDRGPDTPGVLRLVMGMVADGDALCVSGNHEAKLVRALRGRKVSTGHGLAETLEQLAAEPDEFRARVLDFCDGLISHYVLDGGRLVVAHAGLKEAYHGRSSGKVRSFALYGDTTGETDEYGLPVRYPWAEEYRGRAAVVYGHTPVPSAEWVNNTICLDTGAVFGGRLTALRYPERRLVDVVAERVWYEPSRPFPAAGERPAAREPGVLDAADVLGRDAVHTAYGRIAVDPGARGGALAALEVMSRFAADPRWLVYLPPTMAPCPTTDRPGLLEHPAGAFAYYLDQGVGEVVCEEKHMGSRAVAVVCRDAAAAARRFAPGARGAVYTRTGRPFFTDAALAASVLDELAETVARAGIFNELDTDWVLLDGELLPWSAKADGLIREQYASVAAAAGSALPAAADAIDRAAARGLPEPEGARLAELAGRAARRSTSVVAFAEVYRRYRWRTDGRDGLAFAPFQLLAGEGAAYTGRDHGWQLALAERLAAASVHVAAAEGREALVRATRHRTVDLTDPSAVAAATAWWEELTAAGGEGMVVKPLGGGTVRGGRDLVQPGLKVRGPEYLRIIYGPDYLEAGRLDRLRDRRLGRKRGLALREHKLGLEAVARLAGGEPLWRVHEAVFAVLAAETEPVDPRL
ncbi:polynucleotide kinase-phosphatase [Allonocardiopsis opalescens]|uniref:Polynucleotide kinase-phosphatase n=1 Tax=Allonocardiopsis opalescens TaxID=1144618 RepID=A0A2T0Q8E2_9ACTN|nr:polynucleotide kinase-phosphatase [Allonocardiopsis opalescens]PRY00043.1 polynucleotide kinase-phosphatase [Allonocardiopsis opalescens]